MNVTTCEPLSYDTAAGDMPEASRQPAREVCKPGAHFPESTAVPNVLLIGDSVASGYESFVRDELMGVAQVQLSPWLFSNNPVDGAGEPGYFAMCASPAHKRRLAVALRAAARPTSLLSTGRAPRQVLRVHAARTRRHTTAAGRRVVQLRLPQPQRERGEARVRPAQLRVRVRGGPRSRGGRAHELVPRPAARALAADAPLRADHAHALLRARRRGHTSTQRETSPRRPSMAWPTAPFISLLLA